MMSTQYWQSGLFRQLRQSPRVIAVSRYVLPLAAVIVVTPLISQSPLRGPAGGVVSMLVVLICAWIGGAGPALFMPPLLLLISRLSRDPAERWVAMTSQEMMAFVVITLITASTGLAGQYRRRIRTVTEQHAQKLRQQARALSQSPIVFRSVNGEITEWNEGCERLFGWVAAEAVGRQLHELLQIQYPQPLGEIDDELGRSGQWRGEILCRDKNGNELHLTVHSILYRDGVDNPVGVAEVLGDVTELRRAEAAIREADRRKDEFLAMLAHELRNPLAPIRTGLELMKLIGDDPDELETTRAMMERQMKQLVTLVDDLLDVSRITRGKLELRKRRVALSEIIDSAIEAAKPAIDKAGHQLTVKLAAAPVCLNADPHRCAQVVSNLLDNATKYTPAGGKISLAAEQQGDEVVLSVIDNGMGIPADMLDQVFEWFTRSNHDARLTHAGLGIGLALVKTIIEMHGGRVEAYSDGLGRGAKFIVRLPAAASFQAEIKHKRDARGSAERGKRKVLIVDDNIDAARSLSVVVKHLGNEVQTAYDGFEAIAVAERFDPEVILLDLGMPKLDGYGAARHIRQQPWGQGILLIAVTGWGQDSDKKRTKEAGFDHHLVKPADLAELQQLLSQAH